MPDGCRLWHPVPAVQRVNVRLRRRRTMYRSRVHHHNRSAGRPADRPNFRIVVTLRFCKYPVLGCPTLSAGSDPSKGTLLKIGCASPTFLTKQHANPPAPARTMAAEFSTRSQAAYRRYAACALCCAYRSLLCGNSASQVCLYAAAGHFDRGPACAPRFVGAS